MQSVPEVLNRSRSARSYRAEGTRIMPNYLTWRWRQVPERMRAEYFTLIRRDALEKWLCTWRFKRGRCLSSIWSFCAEKARANSPDQVGLNLHKLLQFVWVNKKSNHKDIRARPPEAISGCLSPPVIFTLPLSNKNEQADVTTNLHPPRGQIKFPVH